jgi:choline dehydrogenase-like flavoprotein
MPTVTTGNTNAPSIMIGERVAEFVAGQAPPYATTRSVAMPSRNPIPSM